MSWSRTRAGLALAALAALAVAVGCAPSGELRTPVAVEPVPYLPVLTAGQTRGLTSLPWSRQAPAGTGDSVMVQVPAAGCPRLRGAVVTETAAAVTLQIFASPGRCPGDERGFLAVPVRLPGPLDRRELRHGPVAAGVPPIGNGPPARRTVAQRNRPNTH
jgi:hypothetical protein